MSKKSAHTKSSIHSASQRAPLNLNANYIIVNKYTCIYQVSYKTEIFKSFYSMHFYFDLLLIHLAHYVEFISCFCFSAWYKQVFFMNWQWKSTVILWENYCFNLSIKFEELIRKKYWVWNSRWWILKITFFFGIGNNKLYSCIKNVVPIGR